PYQKIYAEYYKELYKSRYTPGDYASDMADYKEDSDDEQFTCRIIGVDEEEFRILNQSAGEKLDADEFEDGKVCFACKFFTEGDNHIPGHSVRFVLSKDGQDMKCRIKVGAMLDSNPAYYSAGYSPDLIVSKSYVKRLLGDAALTEMLKIDYINAYDKKTEDEIKQLMKGNKKVSLESKLGRLEEMKKEENRIRLLGNTIASLIAVMAILNFVNMICASLEQRRNEFAIMESIGMTRRQQRKMIVLEAVMYAGISIVISCFAGIPLSVLAFNNFKRYAIRFVMPVVSDLGVFLFILSVCAVVSLVAFSQMRKMSIVELMKNNV
ncbi:MAG: ABC transporter permease, partial [Lachnospiraceae bacterium]|nr:ABC transporter permease [Lachnospiraceae bacterium]